MLDQLKTSVKQGIDKTFPERQIIHRTSGQLHSFVIGQKTQMAAAALAAFIATWCIVTLINLAWGHNPLRSPAKEVKRVEAQFERLLLDARANEANALALLEAQQREFTTAARDFEQRHQTLKQILGSGSVVTTQEPITSTQYASQSVLMSPVVRDVHPRRARSESVDTIEATATNLQGVSFAGLAMDQNEILLEAEDLAQEKIEANRAIITQAGLNVESMLSNSPFGMGGPEVLLTDDTATPDDANFGSRVASIRARVAEAEALDRALSSIPFGVPVDDDHYRTSAFGPRKDPFTKRTAFHGGIDLGGRPLAPIVATAAGRVSFVGTKGGYGRVIEIDHDHGIKTRYAHLAKSYVKRGQIIAKGEKIGGMGSSGRSTSTHLHYEVMFQGRAKDPENFMKAGRYVQQD